MTSNKGMAHPSPTVGPQADAFDAAFRRAGIPSELADGFWDIWVRNPRRAHALVERWARGGLADEASADEDQQPPC